MLQYLRLLPAIVLFALSASGNSATAQDVEAIWTSRERCLDTTIASETEPESRGPRIGTWNLRWFPRGCPDVRGCTVSTDIEWMACTIAALDLDVLAVQEIVTYPEDQERTDAFLAFLSDLTKSNWSLDLQDCGYPNSQRLGFLWRADRVHLSDLEDIAGLNGASDDPGDACAGSLRPGLAATLKFNSLSEPIHVLNVHLDAGDSEKDFRTRMNALARLSEMTDNPDSPFQRAIVLGDFNTVGRRGPNRVTSLQELAILETQVDGRLHLPERSDDCSQYSRGRPNSLDQILVSTALLDQIVSFTTEGVCRRLSCSAPGNTRPSSQDNLSDHCPIVVELEKS